MGDLLESSSQGDLSRDNIVTINLDVGTMNLDGGGVLIRGGFLLGGRLYVYIYIYIYKSIGRLGVNCQTFSVPRGTRLALGGRSGAALAAHRRPMNITYEGDW